MSSDVPDFGVFTTRMHRLHGLLDADRRALERLPFRTTNVPAGHDILRASEAADHCAVILSGMACSYKLTGEGGRQIVGLHIAGDLPDLQSLRSQIVDASVAAVTGCQVGFIPQNALTHLCSSRQGLTDILWREMRLQSAILREWLLNMGRRDALAGLAHLLCETVVRHRVAGLTSTDECPFALTQALLGDALGLSTVHVNRVVKDLRRESLIAWDGRRLIILDWERLKKLADFDPAYLLDRSPMVV